MYERKRLVVELSEKVNDQLKELTKTEDANKTTVVNKSIQLLHLVRQIEKEGGSIQIKDKNGTITKLVILQ